MASTILSYLLLVVYYKFRLRVTTRQIWNRLVRYNYERDSCLPEEHCICNMPICSGWFSLTEKITVQHNEPLLMRRYCRRLGSERRCSDMSYFLQLGRHRRWDHPLGFHCFHNCWPVLLLDSLIFFANKLSISPIELMLSNSTIPDIIT